MISTHHRPIMATRTYTTPLLATSIANILGIKKAAEESRIIYHKPPLLLFIFRGRYGHYDYWFHDHPCYCDHVRVHDCLIGRRRIRDQAIRRCLRHYRICGHSYVLCPYLYALYPDRPCLRYLEEDLSD